MRTGVLCIAAIAAAAAFPAMAGSSRGATPPRGLTMYGRIVWNFEGLLRQQLGSAHACEAASAQTGPSLNWTRAACNRANAYRINWQPVFARHSATTFAVTSSAPPNLGNVAPIRIAGRYVRCSTTAWLVENNTGGWLCLST
jgi:hypothetical protein